MLDPLIIKYKMDLSYSRLTQGFLFGWYKILFCFILTYSKYFE